MQLGASKEPFHVPAYTSGAIPQPNTHFEIVVLDNFLDKMGIAITTLGARLVSSLPKEYYTVYVSNVELMTVVTLASDATWSNSQAFPSSQ